MPWLHQELFHSLVFVADCSKTGDRNDMEYKFENADELTQYY